MAGLKKMESAVKTMIYLDQTVHTALKRRAQAMRISMADLIRQAIAVYLDEYLVEPKSAVKSAALAKGYLGPKLSPKRKAVVRQSIEHIASPGPKSVARKAVRP